MNGAKFIGGGESLGLCHVVVGGEFVDWLGLEVGVFVEWALCGGVVNGEKVGKLGFWLLLLFEG